MADVKSMIIDLKEIIESILIMDKHNKHLTNELAIHEPSNNTVKAQLLNVGFGSEGTNEDNLKLLLDHHTNLVAENTRLHETINSRDALMEQLREVVLVDGD